jgi:hypothetical protein
MHQRKDEVPKRKKMADPGTVNGIENKQNNNGMHHKQCGCFVGARSCAMTERRKKKTEKEKKEMNYNDRN